MLKEIKLAETYYELDNMLIQRAKRIKKTFSKLSDANRFPLSLCNVICDPILFACFCVTCRAVGPHNLLNASVIQYCLSRS